MFEEARIPRHDENTVDTIEIMSGTEEIMSDTTMSDTEENM